MRGIGRWSMLAAAGLLAGSVLLAGCQGGAKQDGVVKITFWEWWADQQPILEQLARDYQDRTGIKVAFELSTPTGSDYFNKIQAAAQANTLPDIIGLAGGGETLARYINAGRIYEITSELNANNFAWRKSFFPRAIEGFYYEPGNIYDVKGDSFWGVPLSVMNIQVYYNQELFQQAGLDAEDTPETWEEFLAVGQRLRAAGLNPFVIGFGDLWIDYTVFNALCWAYLGEDDMRGLYTGEVPYTEDGCQRAMERIADLRTAEMLYPGAVSMANKDAEMIFANGKAAMMLNGSWAVNVYWGMNPDLKLGVFPLPKPEDAEHPMFLIGGVGKGAAVTTNSDYPEQAVAFLHWLTAKEQQVRLAKEARMIPANFEAMEDLDPLLKGFAQGMRNLTPDLKLEEKFEVREVLSKGVQSILIGESDPQDVLRDAWEAKQRILEAR